MLEIKASLLILLGTYIEEAQITQQTNTHRRTVPAQAPHAHQAALTQTQTIIRGAQYPAKACWQVSPHAQAGTEVSLVAGSDLWSAY